MAPDGSFLVYTSNRAAAVDAPALHGGQLWRVDRHGDGWGEPVRLPDAVNVGTSVYAPSVAANGDVYYQRRDDATHEFHLYRTAWHRSEEHTSEPQSLMRISYAVFCLKKKQPNRINANTQHRPRTT